ncbi:MurR/RpiR family transcriptional regulator [Enterococcus hulanensis]|uniref:MurR/RpiR family transcriptional regulator n=1 Tax=Enterococcus hulanensis TaxID=2559929 RepID=A0ABU3F2D8_9ENTE|nr:MurR/RpiR family transcriptional regulator [Enterococcus hulanensis]MDT2601289.1 MurR/RpiR family transcriptional regulator [Enterococcus hulanensis]MDT2610801.1 MurR/RpiR family transcriptional regulator [Enterococcus hulanensis]MDT2618206.1 MurR/RpiR family transcriptional regulator [Enterococcus hulanensis]MDT2629224.1 MurR/RpiR family transcriptional regulator [Enterococcus hulanensis]MDT2656771.1 MurR/RpiR family transcriptional regulator [Enterococcus hulanensis]
MSSPIHLQIKSMYNDFSPKEQAIADYILENPSKVSHSSISDLSAELGIADSTFFQFTKTLGFNGFKDFKMALLKQENDLTAITIHENVQKDDSELVMAQKVFDSNVSTLTDTKKLLQEADLKKAVKMISDSRRLYFFGVGGSEIVATDAYHKFLRSPIPVGHSTDYHLQLMEASLLTEEDCAMFISHSGKSKETIHIAEAAKKNGAKVIVMTSQINSPLAKLGDVVFISISEEIEFRSEALASRIAQLSIIDSLYVILMFHNRENAQDTISKVREVIQGLKESKTD